MLLAWVLGTASAWAADRPPSNDEYALLVLANETRSDPASYGLPHLPSPPLAWSADLYAAARFHSDDMAAHPGCFGHYSCNGETFQRRLARFYPGYGYIAENVSSFSSLPELIHEGFLASQAGHRETLLSPIYMEFGAAISIGSTPSGLVAYTTQNFGTRDWVVPPPIPAGCVLPRVTQSSMSRKFLVNYYDPSGRAPRSVRAIVGSSCIDLPLVAGKPDHGTYGATKNVAGSGCVPMVYEAVRADGTLYRWPESGAVLIGVGTTSCAERAASAPTPSCAGGPGPQPTPTPTPTPTPKPPTDDAAPLAALKGALRGRAADPTSGSVQLTGTFAEPAGFAPSANGAELTLTYGANQRFSVTLPKLCSGAPCLKGNARQTSFTAKYPGNRRLTLTRNAKGVWRFRFNAPKEKVGTLGSGPVEATLEVGGSTFTGRASGTLRGRALTVK
ncbi:MAG TPA: CAP domain-containing protein [Candidatus Binatia bacterium]